ncbi:hypothetical protein [Paracoccus litorisediminis]|uniref:Uncharacterized protein n=1 Tax=Paracoccus litorisediminis TaxID=2006130 RepID=A0A844HQA0_9RHOB|nr:hypothetical protein [Paracoccus litorisediminis]MTH62573.1 hypothetical protein [Paracoccus litorisediminis]
MIVDTVVEGLAFIVLRLIGQVLVNGSGKMGLDQVQGRRSQHLGGCRQAPRSLTPLASI